MKKRHGTNCNIYRLQDAWAHYADPDGYNFQTRSGSVMQPGTTAYNRRCVTLQRAALRDACVVIPRSIKTPAALAALAVKVGNLHGFDAKLGNYRR